MKRLLALLVAILVVSPSLGFIFGSKQRVLIKGRLMCGNEPARNVLVKLVDEDTGPDPDDEMAHARTDAQGEFRLDGTESEVGNIDPWLKIYHDCIDRALLGIPCQRKWKWKIPKKYINTKNGEGIDIGTWNLELEPRKEERDCIH